MCRRTSLLVQCVHSGQEVIVSVGSLMDAARDRRGHSTSVRPIRKAPQDHLGFTSHYRSFTSPTAATIIVPLERADRWQPPSEHS